MKKNLKTIIAVITLFFVGACAKPLPHAEKCYQPTWTQKIFGGGFAWNLPKGIEPPCVPKFNPMSNAKVEFGRYLFYDNRLSQDETMSCASCHFQELGFTDGKAQPRGIPNGMGQIHPRSAQHLMNSAYYSMSTWANPVLTTLEAQARVPMFFTANAVKELGLEGNDYLDKLNKDELYKKLCQEAFGTDVIAETQVRFALAAFERAMTSFHSPYDKYKGGKKDAISDAAKRGEELFNSEKTNCFSCHPAPYFSESVATQSGKFNLQYRHNGLKSKAQYDALPLNERGLEEFTLDETDQGKFRAPTLRNIMVTFPFMHDGSIGCSEANRKNNKECAREAMLNVLAHYASGGKDHPIKDPLIKPRTLSDDEKNDLVEFLFTLTDENFLKDESFSAPKR